MDKDEEKKEPKKAYTLPIGPNEPSVWGKLATLAVVVIGTIIRKITGR